MIIIKGYKIRLLPTLEQEMLIRKSIGVSRFVYKNLARKSISFR